MNQFTLQGMILQTFNRNDSNWAIIKLHDRDIKLFLPDDVDLREFVDMRYATIQGKIVGDLNYLTCAILVVEHWEPLIYDENATSFKHTMTATITGKVNSYNHDFLDITCSDINRRLCTKVDLSYCFLLDNYLSKDMDVDLSLSLRYDREIGSNIVTVDELTIMKQDHVMTMEQQV